MRNFLSNQKISSFSLTFFLAAILALLAGCGPGTSDTATPTSPATPILSIQLYAANGAVATSVSPGVNATAVAVVTSDTGVAVPNTVVTFVVTDTTLAVVSQATALTDGNGLAQVILSANGTGAIGATSISASASVTTATGPVTATGQTSFAVTAGGGGPGPSPLPTLTLQLTNSAGIEITAISSITQGTAKVTIKDGSGVVVPNVIVTFSVADAALAGISPATTALTDINGVASVKLTAKSPGATSVTATATVSGTPLSGSKPFSVTTSAPSLSLSLSSTMVTTANPAIVTANLRDGAGVVMPGVVVTFTVANTLFASVTASATTDAFGNATATLTAIATGNTSISASAPVPNFPPNNLVTAGPYNFSVVTTVSAASLSLSAIPTSVKSDNSNSATVTVTALNSGNAAVSGVVVNLSVDTGIVSTPTVTTGADGKATFTFSSGTASKANRTATITASAGVTTHLLIPIQGSTLTVNATGASVPDSGLNPVTMTFTAKDAGGTPIPGAAIGLTSPAGVTLSPLCAVVAPCSTDANGQLVITVTSTGGFSCTTNCVVAAPLPNGVGATASAPITVTSSLATFSISESQLNADPVIADPTAVAMQIGNSLYVLVKAPAPIAYVVFATTMGSWNGLGTSLKVPVGGPACGTIVPAADEACATLTTATAGLANVQVYDFDNPATTDSMTVSMTATTPYKITVQASPTVVGKCSGTSCPFSTLIATVTDINGLPVGNVQVLFSILNPTGGGENISPVAQTTAAVATTGLALGQARTQFTSGSLSSGASGIKIHAEVQGYPAVATGLLPSGNDAVITIGGTAGSIAFGLSSKTLSSQNDTAYDYPMSVIVTDSNGNPAPAGTAVNLSAWPIGWSTGSPCNLDNDTAFTGTFLNEDINENVFLDALEDGKRTYYYGTFAATTGTFDGLLTPPNAAAGSLPGIVYTDASGVATFTLVYPKTSAIWIIDRIRASTVVQGTEAVSEVRFRLGFATTDFNATDETKCFLPASPYFF